MNHQEITSLIGLRSDTREVEALLQACNAAPPRLPAGEYNAYAGSKAMGLCLLFQDEGYFKKLNAPLGVSPLALVGAFFYSEGFDSYSQFAGSLPRDITFKDDRGVLARKLGTSEWTREKEGMVRREIWPSYPYKLTVNYKATGAISIIYYGIT